MPLNEPIFLFEATADFSRCLDLPSRSASRREPPMNLNYLFYRQQMEWIRADRARSTAAAKAHAELARQFERQIECETQDRVRFARRTADPRSEPSFALPHAAVAAE